MDCLFREFVHGMKKADAYPLPVIIKSDWLNRMYEKAAGNYACPIRESVMSIILALRQAAADGDNGRELVKGYSKILVKLFWKVDEWLCQAKNTKYKEDAWQAVCDVYKDALQDNEKNASAIIIFITIKRFRELEELY